MVLGPYMYIHILCIKHAPLCVPVGKAATQINTFVHMVRCQRKSACTIHVQIYLVHHTCTSDCASRKAARKQTLSCIWASFTVLGPYMYIHCLCIEHTPVCVSVGKAATQISTFVHMVKCQPKSACTIHVQICLGHHTLTSDCAGRKAKRNKHFRAYGQMRT